MKRKPIQLLVAFLSVSCTVSMATEYYVATDGLDANAGTKANPFRTIQKAADIMKPGDTCIVRGGVYRETVRPTTSGQKGKPIRFIAGKGEKVILKGTEPIKAQWKPYKPKIYDSEGEVIRKGTKPIKAQCKLYNPNIYQAYVEADFPQLFVDGKMMVEARWPNMRFPDELWDRSKWAETGKGSRHGKIVDPKLAETGIDWTGARATLNVAHQFFSWTRTVSKHTAGSDTFEYPPDLQGIAWVGNHPELTWPWEDDRYYLSGKLEALDAPGEWFLDTQTSTLYLWPLGDKKPAACRIEAKTRNYALEVQNVDYIELNGFRFFGTTFLLRNCSHCIIENCHLSYPTYARRIADPKSKESWVTTTIVDGYHNTVRKSSFAYSPTAGLNLVGADNLAEDNLLHDICWYGCLRYLPLRVSGRKDGGKASAGTIRHNTVHNFGNAGVSFGRLPCVVEYNHVYDGGLACEDVSLIYTAWPTCAGSVIRYNWVHGSRTEHGKGLGIRGDDITRRLTVHHNVVWDCGLNGIIVKGDHNKVYNNTVLNVGERTNPGNYIALHTRAEPEKPWQTLRKKYNLLERQNANSEIYNNVALTITSHNFGYSFPSGPNVGNNYHDTDIKLRNPRKMDFRPKEGSPLIDAGREIPGFTDGFAGDAPDIGAYEFGGENWKAGITWQPKKRTGRRPKNN